MNNFLGSLPTLLVTLTALVGLIVLTALHDVGEAVAIPVIAGLAGVHIGAGLGNSSGVTGVTGNSTTPFVP